LIAAISKIRAGRKKRVAMLRFIVDLLVQQTRDDLLSAMVNCAPRAGPASIQEPC
jgi:hypothetical protein